MKEKKLLQEYRTFNPKIIVEESSKEKKPKLLVEGTLQRIGTKNQNGRIYPKEILEREINFYQKKIDERRALGELDHPDSETVNLKNVSHNIVEVWWEGNDLKGRAEILNTPSGNILKSLIEDDITIGISSRGMGSILQIDESTVEVQDDFELLCWDFVSDPSTHEAFMYEVNEGKQLTEAKKKKSNIDTNIDKLLTEIICDLTGKCCID